MTETSVAPMAERMSTPSANVSMGVITIPPPKSVSDPMNPARSDANQTAAVNSTMFNQRLRFV
jgi:hypothetical protein